MNVLDAPPEDLDPKTRPYGPRGAALALFYNKSPEILLDGPAGTGKSRAILEKIHLCMLKYRGARALIVRKTRTSMTESALVTYENKVLPVGSPLKDGPQRAMRQAYHYPNGSELVVGGMDKADKVMSTEYDIIGVFEATELTEDDLEKLTTRLSNGVMPYQQLLADCNPAGPKHWLNQRALRGAMTRLLSRHEDNPTVTNDYLDKLRALTGARRLRLYEGKWAAQEGLVYDEWSDANYVDAMPAGWEAWRKIRSIDFGFTNPFVCQWWAIDPDGRMYLYREIYKTQTIVEDHAARIKDLSTGEAYATTVADHDAEDRATLDKHGIHTIAANKAITPGIQAVQSRIRPAGDGRPRLFFLRGALVEADTALIEAKRPYSTDQEVGEYVWQKDKDGKPQKEFPTDLHNHGMDAMRYAVAYVDPLTIVYEQPRRRSVTMRGG
jgi:PBSX family phage terminase large subunit